MITKSEVSQLGDSVAHTAVELAHRIAVVLPGGSVGSARIDLPLAAAAEATKVVDERSVQVGVRQVEKKGAAGRSGGGEEGCGEGGVASVQRAVVSLVSMYLQSVAAYLL